MVVALSMLLHCAIKIQRRTDDSKIARNNPRFLITSFQTKADQRSTHRLCTFLAYSSQSLLDLGGICGRMFLDVGADMMRVEISSDLDNQAFGVELDNVAKLVAKVVLYADASDRSVTSPASCGST